MKTWESPILYVIMRFISSHNVNLFVAPLTRIFPGSSEAYLQRSAPLAIQATTLIYAFLGLREILMFQQANCDLGISNIPGVTNNSRGVPF